MPKEQLLPKDTSLVGTEYVRMIDKDGKSVAVPIASFDNYIQRASYFDIIDGATDISSYSESFGNVAGIDLPIRFGISGPLSDDTYWPEIYGPLISNQASAPASSSFDFRLLTNLGTYITFDIEFKLRLGDDGGNRINLSYPLIAEFTMPNGDIISREVTVPNDYIVATTAVKYGYKITFSTYIKDLLLDSLVGGNMRLYSSSVLGVSEILTITDLKATIKI